MDKERVVSYDIFRGFLLIGMLVFHVLINLTTLSFDQRHFYWIPMGFIMFLGIILGTFLKNRTSKKLKLGIKLLGLFLVLNIYNFIQKNISLESFIGGDQVLFSFEILFPMSLLVFFTIIFDKWAHYWKTFLLSSFSLLIILNYLEIYYYNLSFLTYGFIGYFLAFGFDIDRLSRKYKDWKYILTFMCIAIVPSFIVQFSGLYDFVLVFQILALYHLSILTFKKSKVLNFLGKHSLLLYLTHIIVIKIIAISLKGY